MAEIYCALFNTFAQSLLIGGKDLGSARNPPTRGLDQLTAPTPWVEASGQLLAMTL